MDNLVQNINYQNNSAELQKYRKDSLLAFQKQGLPTAKTEAWKYTRIRDLKNDDYQPAPQVNKTGGKVPFTAEIIEICNGYIVSMPKTVSGINIKPITEAAQYLGQTYKAEEYPFAALNGYYLDRGLFIEITGDLKYPLILNYNMVPEDKDYFYHFRNVIICRQGAKAEIIEQFNYQGELKSRYLANIVNEIRLEDKSVLCHYKYQNEAFKANHIALNAVQIAKDGKYESFCLQKGANIARNETFVSLNDEGAEAVVNGAYIMNGWATLDTTTDIYHLKPHTKSSQIVKGVVGGEAKGVFQGRIHIAPDAVATSGTQLHKALLLSDTAEIDVKPELEIFADDVKCSHGAASGELDKEQLFYMRSRGIGEDEAKQILIDAYLNDVINQISDETIKEWFKSLK
ncbi:MAG: Fe-S cluster assembly protein SufD [Alphaproteobacteria bacterium]|nr:Fe-S cluster assembly protein SufD [Alphaproteobacteria bacterium]